MGNKPPYLFPHNVDTDYFTDNNVIGNNLGYSFKFIGLAEGVLLKGIKIWKDRDDRYFTGVEVWMTDGSNFCVGNRQCHSEEFCFKSGELITRLNIKVTKGIEYDISTIMFETSMNREYKIATSGSLKWKEWDYWPDVGSGICCGIFGTFEHHAFWGNHLRGLGFAMLRKFKPIILTNVQYPTLNKEKIATKSIKIDQRSFCNGLDREQTFTMSGKYTVEVTREWSLSLTDASSTSVQVQAGIPKIASAGLVMGWNVSGTDVYKRTLTTSETMSWDWPLVCPPRKRILGKAIIYEDIIGTEYEADLKVHLDSGKDYRLKVTGMYHGINARSDVTVDDLGPYLGVS